MAKTKNIKNKSLSHINVSSSGAAAAAVENRQSDAKNRKSVVKILLAVFALLVVWFIVWLYDWKDEILGLFSKKAAAANKAVSGSSSSASGVGSSNSKLIFNTIVKEVNGTVNYEYMQETPALIWSVNHKLGAIPSVQIFDLAGNQVYPNVSNNMEHIQDPDTLEWKWIVNTTNITFSEAAAGWAIFT